MNDIGIIGLGNMGEAILKALLKTGMRKDKIRCAEAKPGRLRFIKESYGVECMSGIEEIAATSDRIIIAVKPQDSSDLLHNCAPLIREQTVLISIMAGITTSNILSLVGKPAKVVRVMPNVCVKVGEGVMGITANHFVTREEMEETQRIFEPLGRMVEVNEDLMDGVTALGGSGPAFLLLFLEGMIDSGVNMGIPRDKAKILSLQVLKGTAKMLEDEDIHPTIMKEMITSPGGTTIAGLVSLEKDGVRGSVIKAIEKAGKRAKKLSL
ncbi:MAG: pyrroline-5-carboxylate reductase [Syntrophobacterales bacterium]|jgi:pyrroline-5-carboxylate reductase|nr:pyrroline-5-carboxylate reductase [Syntrophobacterales bacterium]